MKKSVDFFEVPLKNKTVYSVAFACECKVGSVTYPQGVGRTKKDAKKEAAKNAFDAILASCNDDTDGPSTFCTPVVLWFNFITSPCN